MKNLRCQKRHLAMCIALASSTSVAPVWAQDAQPTAPRVDVGPIVMDEVVTTARLKNSATAIVEERIEQAYAAEILGIEQISAVGDSNVASALRRVTGLTLLNGKFIYVRGLGERYSSTTLNGALLPSPDLTRNVVPLDLFPSSILESIKVQKAYSADQPAAFGGGNIDIRTRSLPDGPLFNISIGTGFSSNNNDDGLDVVGDLGQTPGLIRQAIPQFRGDISVNGISQVLQNQNPLLSGPQAQAMARAINKPLLLSLDRDIELDEESIDPDIGGSIAWGNKWFLTDDIEFGTLLSVEQDVKTRNEDQFKQDIEDSTQFDDVQRTFREENTVYAANFGLDYLGKYTINTSSFLIINDSDQASIAERFDVNNRQQDGVQAVIFSSNLEERELLINQVTGLINIQDDDFGLVYLPKFIEEVNINWYYSNAEAETELPSSTNVQNRRTFDTATGETLTFGLLSTTRAGTFTFLDLEDNIEAYGFSLDAPFVRGNFLGSITGGYSRSVKDRTYQGLTVNIDAVGLSQDVLNGTPANVLNDQNLGANNFEVSLGAGQGAESYVSGEVLESAYGGIDVTWNNTWRVSAGLRWEDFSRGVLSFDLLDFEGEQIRRNIMLLSDPGQTLGFQDDEIYSSFAVTWIDNSGFLGAQDFQIRFGYGDTVVRPDLRELAPVVYQDQISRDNYRGNPFLQQSTIDHYDLRAELFYDDGSNLTISLFYKDIDLPIETVEEANSASNKQFTFINADEGEVFGIEFEGLKEIGNGFFLSGNVTISDSEIDFESTDLGQTNLDRRLTGHSRYVVNGQLGYDSPGGTYSILGAYNVFGERVVAGGRDGNGDIFEQPFNSVDVVFSYFPTDNFKVKLKVQNLLDEEVEREQKASNGQTFDVLTQEKGINASIDLSWDF